MDYRLLYAKTVAELRAMAREEKIKIPTGASKARIVELILEIENGRAAELALQQAQAQRSAEEKLAAKKAEATSSKSDESAPAKSAEAASPEAALSKSVGDTPEKFAEAASVNSADPALVEPPKRKRGRPPKAKPEAEREKAGFSAGDETAAPEKAVQKKDEAQGMPQTAHSVATPEKSAASQPAPDPSSMQIQRPLQQTAPHQTDMPHTEEVRTQPQRISAKDEQQRSVYSRYERAYGRYNAPERRQSASYERYNAPEQRQNASYERSAHDADRASEQRQSASYERANRAPEQRQSASYERVDRTPEQRQNASYGRNERDHLQRERGDVQNGPSDQNSRANENPQNGRFGAPYFRNDRPANNLNYANDRGYVRNPDGVQNASNNPNDRSYARNIEGAQSNIGDRGQNAAYGPDNRNYVRNSDAQGPWSNSQGMFSHPNERVQGDRGYARSAEQPRFVRREFVPQDPAEVTRAVSDLLAAGDCAEGGGVLEPMPDGYGFLRAENYQQGSKDVYVSAAQIRRFNLRTGDLVRGKVRPQREGDRYTGLLFIDTVNGQSPEKAMGRPRFEDLTPIYPQKRIRLENKAGKGDTALRVIDLLAPIGRGQRAMIVSQPKAGKTVLLKKIANAITENEPDIELIVLLIDERPEEVTDMQRSIKGDVVYSTFDEVPENHTRVAEMVLERAQRLVEQGKDVVILLDSITRLARAYNLVIPPTGRTLSGGIDPGALHKPKRFFGAARNIENGGSLTIIATALVETGSRMDDVIFEEFKGTGNSEIHLDRRLSEKRIFPAIDMNKSGTRREDLLFTPEEAEGALAVRRMLSGGSNQDAVEQLTSMLHKTQSNAEFLQQLRGLFAKNEKDGFTYGGR